MLDKLLEIIVSEKLYRLLVGPVVVICLPYIVINQNETKNLLTTHIAVSGVKFQEYDRRITVLEETNRIPFRRDPDVDRPKQVIIKERRSAPRLEAQP